MKKILAFWISIILINFSLIGQNDAEVIDIIKKHGLEQSQIMQTASMITDVYGPRLTGSPMLDKATCLRFYKKDFVRNKDYRCHMPIHSYR